jgi:hypothetical protein
MLSPGELKALDDWRFSRRMPTRAATIRDLLRRGLAAEGIDLADPRTLSRDFGLVNQGPQPDSESEDPSDTD